MTQNKLKLYVSSFILSTAVMLISLFMLFSLEINSTESSLFYSIILYVLLACAALGLLIFGFLLTYNPTKTSAQTMEQTNQSEPVDEPADKPADELADKPADEFVMEGFEKYTDLPSYLGKQVFISHSPASKPSKSLMVFLFSLALVPLSVFMYSKLGLNDITGLAILYGSINMINLILNLPNHKVTIDEEGIRSTIKDQHVNQFLNWNEIRQVGIRDTFSGFKGPFICFTVQSENSDSYALEYYTKPYNMAVRYSPKIVHCILQYRNAEIYGLDKMKSWDKYVARVNR